MSLRFLQNFNKDLELIYAKYSNSSEDGPEVLLSACDERENRKLINNYSFSSCGDWQGLPDSEDSSLTDSSLPINSLCSSSDENSGLLSYYKDEVSGDVCTTPVHSCGEESGFSNSDGWESDSSGPIRSYKTVTNKPRLCDKYNRAEKPSPISSLFVDGTQRNVSSTRSGFSDNKALVSTDNLDLSNDDNLYRHTRKYSKKTKNFSKPSSDNRIDLFNAKCPNIVSHSDLLTAVHKFHNLFTNHFATSETRCNHLPELSMISKALDNCYDEKNLGSLEVNRQEFCKESGKKRHFLKAKKSTAVQPRYVVEKLFVRPKGSPMNSFVEIASCQSFDTKTKCFETLSTSNMQCSLDAISRWTKPLPRSPVSDTKYWALDPKISLTPVSNNRVRSPVVKSPSATQSCPPRRCFQASSADDNQHGSFSAVASLTHDLDEISRQRSHTLTSQSSSVNKSKSSRKLRPQAKYSGVKSPGVESPGVKSPGVKIPGVKISLGVKSSVVKSSGIKSSGVKSLVVKSPGLKSSGVKSPGVKSPGVKSPGVKSSGVKSSGIRSPGLKSPGLKSPGLKSPGLKSPGLKSSGLKSSGVKSPGVKNPGVKSPGVKSPGVKSSGLKSSGVKSPGVKNPGVKSSGLKNSGVKSPGVKSLRSIQYLTPFESDQSLSTDDTDIFQTDSKENKKLLLNSTLKVKEHSTLQSCWNRTTDDDRLKSPNSITSRKPGYHKGLKSPVVNTNSCGSDRPSVPLKATPRSNSLRLSDISLGLCQTLIPSEQTSSSGGLKNTGATTSPECGTSFKQNRVPRFGESTPRPINSPSKASSTHAHDKLSGQQHKKRWCKRSDYNHEKLNGASQSCLYNNNESDYTLNVLRSDGDDAQTKATTPSDVNKHGPRQSKPETPQGKKVNGNRFDRFTSPVSSNDDSPRIKNSLKVKNTRRRNSLGFHPYGYSNRKQSPSLSSPLQALAIVSPCDKTLRWSTSGHKPKPRRSIESEIKSKKSSESQKKLPFDAFEKRAASDTSDVMQDCCPGNCTKKFCFNCAMDCS